MGGTERKKAPLSGLLREVKPELQAIVDSMWVERGFVLRLHNGMGYSEYSFDRVEDAETLCSRVEGWALASKKKMRDAGISFYPFPVLQEEKLAVFRMERPAGRRGAFQAGVHRGSGKISPWGSVGGNVKSIQDDFSLSGETIQAGNFTGPRGLLMRDVSVAGG